MVTFYPARPTWRAETFSQALVQLGFSAEDAEMVIAESAIVQSDKCIFLPRMDMDHICDVVIDNTPYGSPNLIDAVLVLECHLDLASASHDEAIAKWPYSGSLWVVGHTIYGRPS